MSLADRTPPSVEEYEAYRSRLSNWGRWGDADVFGTLNHITPEARRRAASLVTEGRTISCGRPIDTVASPRNPYPAHHFESVGPGGLADYIGLFFHGYVNTHLDALSHIRSDFSTPDAPYYNGHAASETGMQGAHQLTIDDWRHGVVTRGVLYDIPRLRGVDYVTRDEPVQGWELEDAARAAGITPLPGDAVLIRCGYTPYFADHPDTPGWSSPAGVHASVLEFLHEHDAALLSWDFLDAPGLEYPSPINVPLHIHMLAIPWMGLPLLDNADFELLAEACAEIGRWEFQFTIAPLIINGGTGSPVNPIAVL